MSSTKYQPPLYQTLNKRKIRSNAIGVTNHGDHLGENYIPDDSERVGASNNSEKLNEFKGESRPPQNTMESFLQNNNSTSVGGDRFYKSLILLVITCGSMFTRYINIGWTTKPIWDERHFGLFGSHYLQRTFYHDVHPPLGKLLVALGGYLAGFDGSFQFRYMDYPPNVNYKAMRLFHATFGMLIVPLAYLTACKLKMSQRASILAACMVLFDNGFTVISRFILLDPILLLFIALSVYFLASFHEKQDSPFTPAWWGALFGLGGSLGMALSVKWIGLFAIALVGLYTIDDLWSKFGDLRITKTTYAKHWLSRTVALIIVPATIYIGCFWVHFSILVNPGTGDGAMDSLFQSRLKGSVLMDCPEDLSFHSIVTLRSSALYGEILHSFDARYPVGSGEQQVSTLERIHSGNVWRVLTKNQTAVVFDHDVPVYDGDTIKLMHSDTGRYLRIRPDHDSILSGARAYEISAGVFEANPMYEEWRIEIVKDMLLEHTPEIVQTLSSQFQLRNTLTGCLLASGMNKYPEWGLVRSEVYCVKDPMTKHMETLWNVEFISSITGARAKTNPRRQVPRNFPLDVIKLHFAMWNSNRNLLPDNDKYNHLTSSAWEWPLMRRGIRMSEWAETDKKIYMLGNPMVWWGSTLAIIAYFTLMGRYLIQLKCGKALAILPEDFSKLVSIGKILIGGWSFQYLPFFFMGRVLYAHHYLPALYFACLFAPFMLDHIANSTATSPQTKNMIFMGVGLSLIIFYLHFSPLTFGTDLTSDKLRYLKWLSTWHLDNPVVPQ